MVKQKLILVGLVLMASSAASMHGFDYQAWTKFAALGKGVGAELLRLGDRTGWVEQVARETACLDALTEASAAQRAAYGNAVRMNSSKQLFALSTFLVVGPVVAVLLTAYFERRAQNAQKEQEEVEEKNLA